MKPVLYRYWQAAIKRWGYTEDPTMGQPLFTEPGVKYEPLYPPQKCMCGLWPHSPGCPTPAAPAQQDSEPAQEQLDAFILRAGFRWGWENVEGAARMMARQAVTELNALAGPQSPSVQQAAATEPTDEQLDALMPEPDEKGESWRDEYGYEKWDYHFSKEQVRKAMRAALAADQKGATPATQHFRTYQAGIDDVGDDAS